MYKMNFDSWFWIHPTIDTLPEHLRYLRKSGVKGVFFQGNQMGRGGQPFDGDSAELRAYIIARLMYNPDLDWRALRREFCTAYYGEAAGRVVESYMDDARKCLLAANVHGFQGPGKEAFTWVTPQMLTRWYALMNQAESLAADYRQRRMAGIARLPIQFTEANLTEEPAKRKVLLQKFLDDARNLGAANCVSEGKAFITWAGAEGLTWK
jgi:hypothetical protein